jgi:hypothetical protein
LAHPAGFEPTTLGSEDRYSISEPTPASKLTSVKAATPAQSPAIEPEKQAIAAPDDVALIAVAWPTLSAGVREAILVLVRAGRTQR